MYGQIATADKAHLVGRKLQPHPVERTELERILLERLDRGAVALEHRHLLRAEQGQAELGIGQHKAARARIGRVGAGERAVAVAVNMVGTAHPHKAAQARAAHRQAVNQHIAAIGQRDGGG